MRKKENKKFKDEILKENPVSERTLEILKKKNTKVVVKNKSTKYHRKILTIDTHYNMLEYYLIVRMFMQEKHGIDNRLLEILFFLYSKKYFTFRDFKEYPLTFSYRRIDKLLELEMVEIFRPDTAKSRQVYKLSQKAIQIVVNFYKYLSGEKQIPTNRMRNPLMARKPKTNRERMIQNMIRKMAAAEEPRFPIE